MGTWINRASDANIDPGLLAWLQAAAAQSGYNVALSSGKREGDPRYHGKGMAADVQLIDPATGKVVPNYQNAGSFSAYQSFANQVRAAQMAADPNAANRLRWGGYFSGGKGKYGALDLMHFDVGGEQTPMGGGSWDTGLTPEQAKIWNLQPGGGYAAANATPVADANTLVDSGPASDLASVFGNSLALQTGAKQRTAPADENPKLVVGRKPVVDVPPPVAPTPAPASAARDTLSAAPAPVAQLADLFTLPTIGQPVAAPVRPGRPKLPTIGYG